MERGKTQNSLSILYQFKGRERGKKKHCLTRDNPLNDRFIRFFSQNNSFKFEIKKQCSKIEAHHQYSLHNVIAYLPDLENIDKWKKKNQKHNKQKKCE